MPGQSPSTPTHCRQQQPGGPGDQDPGEPQDLCGGPGGGVGALSSSLTSHTSPDTPGKKERNSRKQCPYCHKGNIIYMVSIRVYYVLTVLCTHYYYVHTECNQYHYVHGVPINVICTGCTVFTVYLLITKEKPQLKCLIVFRFPRDVTEASH